MRLKDIAQVRTEFEEADFWLIRRGSLETVGTPSREYSPYHIGVRVEKTGLVVPDYLYYVFMYLHQKGHWKALATGSLKLVHISVEDVKNMALLKLK